MEKEHKGRKKGSNRKKATIFTSIKLAIVFSLAIKRFFSVEFVFLSGIYDFDYILILFCLFVVVVVVVVVVVESSFSSLVL